MARCSASSSAAGTPFGSLEYETASWSVSLSPDASSMAFSSSLDSDSAEPVVEFDQNLSDPQIGGDEIVNHFVFGTFDVHFQQVDLLVAKFLADRSELPHRALNNVLAFAGQNHLVRRVSRVRRSFEFRSTIVSGHSDRVKVKGTR